MATLLKSHEIRYISNRRFYTEVYDYSIWKHEDQIAILIAKNERDNFLTKPTDIETCIEGFPEPVIKYQYTYQH